MVSHAYGRALDAEFARLVDAHGHALQWQTDGADLIADRWIHAGGSAGFGHAVSFEQRQSHAIEEVRDGGVERRAAGNRVFHMSTEHIHDRRIDKLVVQRMLHTKRQRNALA